MNNNFDDLLWASEESPYHLGFKDGVEDTFNRIIKRVEKDKTVFDGSTADTNKAVVSYQNGLIEFLEKMKKRT